MRLRESFQFYFTTAKQLGYRYRFVADGAECSFILMLQSNRSVRASLPEESFSRGRWFARP